MFVKCFEKEKDSISVSAKYYYAVFFALAVLNRSLRQCSYGLFENTATFHSSAARFRFFKSLSLAQLESGADLEQLVLYATHLHTHTWLCMEVHSSILTLNT